MCTDDFEQDDGDRDVHYIKYECYGEEKQSMSMLKACIINSIWTLALIGTSVYLLVGFTHV